MRLAAAALAACVAASTAAAQSFAEVDGLVDDWQRSGVFSGALVVQRADETLYARAAGWADPAGGRPFRVDTRSDSASLAKPFTALVALQVAREGRLDLDAPVRRYVTEFPHAATRVRDLLAHSAGLPDYEAFAPLFGEGVPVTTSAMLRALAAAGTPPAFVPGTRFAYCNLCYDVTALVVERATGTGFATLLRQRIWSPAGAGDALLRPARLAELPPDVAVGHRWRNGRYEPYGAVDLEDFHGASNHYVSARAFARLGAGFARAASWIGPAGRDATAQVRLADGAPTGMTLGGWYCDAARVRCYFNGHHRGFDTLLYWDAQRQIAIAWVANAALPPALAPRLTRALIAAAEGRAPEARAPQAVDLDEAALAALGGAHEVPGVGRIDVAFGARHGSLRAPTGVAYETVRISRALYYVPGLDALLGATADGRLVWTGVFVEAVARRVPSPRASAPAPDRQAVGRQLHRQVHVLVGVDDREAERARLEERGLADVDALLAVPRAHRELDFVGAGAHPGPEVHRVAQHAVVGDPAAADEPRRVARERVHGDEHARGGKAADDVDDVDRDAGHGGSALPRVS